MKNYSLKQQIVMTVYDTLRESKFGLNQNHIEKYTSFKVATTYLLFVFLSCLSKV